MTKQPPGYNPKETSNVVPVIRTVTTTPSPKGKQVQLKKKFPKLFGLRCWDMAVTKIKAGIAIEEVARWIQDDMMEYRDSKRESLTRALYRFKSELDPEEIVTSKPTYVDEAVEKMRRGINELDELEKLYLLQLKRISIDASTEDKINKLFKTTNTEIGLAKDLLVKRMELKQKMGLVDTIATEVNVNQTSANFHMHTAPVAGAATIEGEHALGLDEERRTKLGLVAQKLLTGLMKSSDSEIKDAVIISEDSPR